MSKNTKQVVYAAAIAFAVYYAYRVMAARRAS